MAFEFYQLSGHPFRLTPDPHAFFASKAHCEALACLEFGLKQGEGFVLLTGDEGAGKSILAAHFLKTLDSTRYTAAQIRSSRLDGTEIVHAAAYAFKCHGSELARDSVNKASALAVLERFLQQEAAAGRQCLLVIDEAHNLSSDALEELRMLLNFELGGRPMLQILLLAQPGIEELLQQCPSVSQRIVAAHRLAPIDAEEIRSYVEHRLQMTGWNGASPTIDPAIYARLALASSANPGTINRILNRLLQKGEARRAAVLDSSTLADVIEELVEEWQAPQAIRSSSPNEGDSRAEATLAVHDELIMQLQQAVVELAEIHNSTFAIQGREDDILDVLAETAQRIAALESRSLEQQQTIRHTLTMLIEWIEGGASQRIAA